MSCTTAVTIDYGGVHQHSANSKPAIKFNNLPHRPILRYTLVILQPLTTHGPMFRLTTAPATPLTTAPPRARPAAPGVLSCHYPTLPLTQPLQPINTHNLTHSVITIVLSPARSVSRLAAGTQTEPRPGLLRQLVLCLLANQVIFLSDSPQYYLVLLTTHSVSITHHPQC